VKRLLLLAMMLPIICNVFFHRDVYSVTLKEVVVWLELKTSPLSPDDTELKVGIVLMEWYFLRSVRAIL